MTTLDGNNIFGVAVHVSQSPHPLALQMNEYFGLNGKQTLYGGSRGRVFHVSGVLTAPDLPTLNAFEAELLSFADGLPHTLIDNRGRTWTNVVFPGDFSASPLGPRLLAGGGWCLPYRLTLEGLI